MTACATCTYDAWATGGTDAPFALMSEGLNWPGMEGRMVPTFDLVENAKEVYRQIRTAQDA